MNLIFNLGNQLNINISRLTQANPATDYVLMCEIREEARYLKHHKKKLAFILAAMRHFIKQFAQRGLYCYLMPNYVKNNVSNHEPSLPGFWGNAKTELSCLKQCICDAKPLAHAHHIQRLMEVGNFSLPTVLVIIYADAFQWIEQP